MEWLALLLIPLCAEINHLGGQSTEIPNPRIACRVFAMPVTIWAAFILGGSPIETSTELLITLFAGFALWAVFKWGPMFMTINNVILDCRDYTKKWYTPNFYLTKITDSLCGVSPLTKLTVAQQKEWGMVYGSLRGGFLYPLFVALSFSVSMWALPFGFFCFFQGLVYRLSPTVRSAEYKFGGLIGAAFAALIIISK